LGNRKTKKRRGELLGNTTKNRQRGKKKPEKEKREEAGLSRGRGIGFQLALRAKVK